MLSIQKHQNFETVAIATTRSQKMVANRAVIEFTHKILTLKGVAEKLPLVASDYVPSADWLKASTTAGDQDWYNLTDFPRF
jgi:hypothetical protein